MSQNIYFWGDMSLNPITPFIDTQGYFNPGANNVNTDDILSDVTNFSSGSYSLGMTPNIPLFFSCSIAYSASILGISGENQLQLLVSTILQVITLVVYITKPLLLMILQAYPLLGYIYLHLL